MNTKLKEIFDYYNKLDLSESVIERIEEVLTEMFDKETVTCPHCERVFLESEDALTYEQADGSYTCECKSPENQISAIEDLMTDFKKEF